MTITIRDATRILSVSSVMPAKSVELKHTISLIQELDAEIDDVETEIKSIIYQTVSPILSIPSIRYRMGAMIVAEIGDFNHFDSPHKILVHGVTVTINLSISTNGI